MGEGDFCLKVNKETKEKWGKIKLVKVQVMRMRQLARWGETCRGRTRQEGEIADFSVSDRNLLA